MKKFLLLATVLFSGLTMMAQKATNDMITVSADSHNFGKIPQGVPATTFFTITNTTERPIAIESATAGCGCTTPEFSKDPIAPGASSKIKVGYNAAAPGFFTKEVTIKIAGATDVKVVRITGEVVTENPAPSTPNVTAAPAVPAKPVTPATTAAPVKKATTPKKSKKP